MLPPALHSGCPQQAELPRLLLAQPGAASALCLDLRTKGGVFCRQTQNGSPDIKKSYISPYTSCIQPPRKAAGMELLLPPLSSSKPLAWRRGRVELLHGCSSRRKWKELAPCLLRTWGTESICRKRCLGKSMSAVVTLRILIASSRRSGLQGLGLLFNGFLLMHRSETTGKC